MSAKIVLVTGANRGIGFEIVRQLARLNHTVVLTARDGQKGPQAIEKLKAENLAAHFIQLDVTDQNQIIEVKEKITNEFGKLDVLINNAGIIVRGDKDLPHVDVKVWNQTMATNAEAPLKISQAMAAIMPSGGHIINMSSSGGSMTDEVGGWSPVYCISKSALNAITRHLSYYLSARGITVNAVNPGWVKTDMGGQSAPRAVEKGAETAVWLATGGIRETGKFFMDKRVIPW